MQYLAFIILQATVHGNLTGSVSYFELIARYAQSAARQFAASSRISQFSNDCNLHITPDARTFNIWWSIYANQASLTLLPNGYDSGERWAVRNAVTASDDWLRTFTTENEIDNEKSLQSINYMLANVTLARESICKKGVRVTGGCCSLTTYESWLMVAQLLSKRIFERYGRTCTATDDQNDVNENSKDVLSFAKFLVHAVEDDVNEVFASRDQRLHTFAWAWKGVCENMHSCAETDNAVDEELLQQASTVRSFVARLRTMRDSHRIVLQYKLFCSLL